MKTIKKRILKLFLFACLSITFATIVFASMKVPFGPPSPPGPPGIPSVFDIEAEWGQIRFKKPKSDGGSRIEAYRIEYNSEESTNGKWVLERTALPLFSIDDIIQSRIDNRVGKNPVIFRAFAKNVAGWGKPSGESSPIIFRDPFPK